MKLCGRGFNILGIKCLIFWDLPATLTEYKFYLGRVGRAGNKAESVAFYENFSGIMDKQMLSFLHTSR